MLVQTYTKTGQNKSTKYITLLVCFFNSLIHVDMFYYYCVSCETVACQEKFVFTGVPELFNTIYH